MRHLRRLGPVSALLAAAAGLALAAMLFGALLASGNAAAAVSRPVAAGARAPGEVASPSLRVQPLPRASLLRLGSRGRAVRVLQGALARLTYLPLGAADGVFGMRTWHAVVAFQGWSGLARDGIAGPRTERALARARRPQPWSTAAGFEVHIPQQVLLLVAHGRVQRAIHVSTGMPGRPTPRGRFRIQARCQLSWSVPFQVWMPFAQYFHGGYAMHEYPSVPAYPASHGCIRVPSAEAGVVWRFGRIGMRLWTTR
ncbi:MAG TPA: L,D-transpeptidase family protein [Solirubrobacteraceae bacterium]|nr:L,D-transpeptidase family protein [Solirubrobacteraceae bacterium]